MNKIPRLPPRWVAAGAQVAPGEDGGDVTPRNAKPGGLPPRILFPDSAARGAERVRLPETLPDRREAAPQTRGTGRGLAFRTHCPPARETRGVLGGRARVRTRDGGPG